MNRARFSLHSMALIFAVFFLFSVFYGGSPRSDETKNVELELLNDDGKRVKVKPDKNTIISINATWCPYSRQLIGFLKDPVILPHIKKYRRIFIFENNEWPTIKKLLLREVSKEEAKTQLEALKQRAGFEAVLDPAFLATVPGEFYFLPKKTNIKFGGFPSGYSGGYQFKMSGYSTVLQFLKNEDEQGLFKIDEIWDKHSPENTMKQQ